MTNKKSRHKKPSVVELKRQLAARKLENQDLKEENRILVQNRDVGDVNPELAKSNPELGGLEDVSVPAPWRPDAKNVPGSIRSALETEEQTLGQDHPRAMRSEGPARQSLDPPVIEPVERPVSKEKLEMLRFMEDELLVMVHDTTNEQDIPIPTVWNDGRSQYFIRGQEQTVKRKFVEILARCKKTTYSQEKRTDADGNDSYIQIPHTALQYPFQVLHDPDPRGAVWLKAILAEA